MNALTRRVADIKRAHVVIGTSTHTRVGDDGIEARIVMVSCIHARILTVSVVMVSCIQTERILAIASIDQFACGRAAEEAEGEDDREMA